MRIGLTFTGWEGKHENYVRWIQSGDPAIEVVRLEAGGGSLDGLDALVLSGGVDVHPDFYGGSLDYPQNEAWKRERDEFEISALHAALDRGLPVLGVCRGLQLINVAMRGSLVQDLGSLDEVHQATPEDKQHGVIVEGAGLLREIVGVDRGVVNSAHHQAIDRLGEGLRVNVRAEDGTIEGVEWAEPAGKPFLLAVQWHPERMYTDGVGSEEFFKGLRERFIREVRG
jgi:putative glutamine amidotransferase